MAQHVARAEGFRRGDLSVAVVGARRMSRLHERYRGDAGPTDVLTFDLGTDRRRAWIEGEIVVCAAAAVSPVFSQRAARARPAAAAELALYVAHGVLHLAGFEDETPGGFRRMHRREAALLADLPGLPAALLRGGGPVE